MKRRMILALALGAVSNCAPGSTAVAAPTEGDGRVVEPGTSPRPVTSGGSRTEFTLALPDGAACPGDSANDDYRVQSYMVPTAVDPGSLTFGSTGPRPPGTGEDLRQPLYQTTSSGYVNAQTANGDFPGDTGAIVNIPTFNFAVFEPGHVPDGAYNIGIACTKGAASATQLVRYWNTTITVSVDPADKPAGIAWKTDSAASPGDSSPAAPVQAAGRADGASPGAADANPAQARGAGSSPRQAASARAADMPENPTGAEPSLSMPAFRIPAHVHSPASSTLVAALWTFAFVVLGRIAWLASARRRARVDSRRLSVLEDE